MPEQSASPNPCPQQNQSQTNITCCQNVFLQHQVSCYWFWFWCAMPCWGQVFACASFLLRLRVKPESQSRHKISNASLCRSVRKVTTAVRSETLQPACQKILHQADTCFTQVRPDRSSQKPGSKTLLPKKVQPWISKFLFQGVAALEL